MNAIAAVLKMLDGELSYIDERINKKHLRPDEEARMVEQARTITVLRTRIENMGNSIPFLPDDPISYRSNHHE